jgi:nucleotide-binding universal stress UspA family protein
MQEPEFKPKRILVPTDFSFSANAALNTAAGLAGELGAAIYLLNVIPMLPIDSEYGYSAIFPEAKYLEYSRRYATEKLQTSIEALHRDGIEAAFGIEIGNDIVGRIMMVLTRERSDLLILSTHGVSGWRPMVFGSIAEKVIKLLECPFLLPRSTKSAA